LNQNRKAVTVTKPVSLFGYVVRLSHVTA